MTDRDIIMKVVANNADPQTVKVAEIMSPRVGDLKPIKWDRSEKIWVGLGKMKKLPYCPVCI